MILEQETGHILDVTEETLGSFLTADCAVGTTVLTVQDAGDFEDDGLGGWLSLNGYVYQYTTVDDELGTITLPTGLTTAASEGDQVGVWDRLYGTQGTVKVASVVLDGEDDNTDPVVAHIADTVPDIPTGIRDSVTAESCALRKIGEDNWQVVSIGGRPSSALMTKFEDRDTFTATTTGDQQFILSHTPVPGSVHLAACGTPQTHNDFTVNTDTNVVTIPDSYGLWAAGDTFDFRYAYRGYDGGDYPAAVLGLTPTFYYRFEDDPTTTLLADETGNNHVGAGGPWPGLGVPGLLNTGERALSFNGTSTTVTPTQDASGSTPLSSALQFTVAALITPQPAPDGDRGTIISSTWSIAGSSNWYLAIDHTNSLKFYSYECYLQNGDPLSVTAGGVVDGQPHLIIVSWNQATKVCRMRVDDVPATVVQWDHDSANSGSRKYLVIGECNYLGGYYLGTMDEVAYWERQLTQLEEDSIVKAWKASKVGT